jgi:hypothetical protein
MLPLNTACLRFGSKGQGRQGPFKVRAAAGRAAEAYETPHTLVVHDRQKSTRRHVKQRHLGIDLNLHGSEGEGVEAKDKVARGRVHNLDLVLDIRQQHGPSESHAGLHTLHTLAYSRSRWVA